MSCSTKNWLCLSNKITPLGQHQTVNQYQGQDSIESPKFPVLWSIFPNLYVKLLYLFTLSASRDTDPLCASSTNTAIFRKRQRFEWWKNEALVPNSERARNHCLVRDKLDFCLWGKKQLLTPAASWNQQKLRPTAKQNTASTGLCRTSRFWCQWELI